MAAGIFTSYEVDNDKRFQKLISDLLLVVDDLSQPFGEIARDLFDSNQAIFNNAPGLYPDYYDSRTGTKGKDTPYAKRKLKLYGRVYPMLVASGKLRDSLTSPSAPNSDTILQIGKRTMVVGTNVANDRGYRYPAVHQTGERKFLFIGPEARKVAPSESFGRPTRWKNIMELWVQRKLRSKQK